MAESQMEGGDSWKGGGSRLNMLMEQGEQHSLFQGLQTSQGVRLATMHDHQEGCLLSCY